MKLCVLGHLGTCLKMSACVIERLSKLSSIGLGSRLLRSPAVSLAVQAIDASFHLIGAYLEDVDVSHQLVDVRAMAWNSAIVLGSGCGNASTWLIACETWFVPRWALEGLRRLISVGERPSTDPQHGPR